MDVSHRLSEKRKRATGHTQDSRTPLSAIATWPLGECFPGVIFRPAPIEMDRRELDRHRGARLVSEPGVFLVKPDHSIYYLAVQSMAFARPNFLEIIQALDVVIKNDYAARSRRFYRCGTLLLENTGSICNPRCQ